MACSLPGIVGDIGVTFENIVPSDIFDEMSDRLGHRIDMTGCAGDRLRNHQAIFIKYTGRQIPGLAYRGGKSGTQQGKRLFLDHRDQPVPHHLHVDA